MSQTRIEWSRLLVEGAVIVVSILLAFAIDAWWDERQALEEARYQVERVVTELESNVDRLERQIEMLDTSTATAREFLGRFGPDPDPLDRDEVSRMFLGLFSSGTLALNRSASENFLSSGQLTRGDWKTIRHELAVLLSEQDAAEKSSVELRQMRPSILELAASFTPLLDISIDHPVMEGYDPSRFPYEPTALIADMEFEGLIATFAIRLEINKSGHQHLLDQHRELLEAIKLAR